MITNTSDTKALEFEMDLDLWAFYDQLETEKAEWIQQNVEQCDIFPLSLFDMDESLEGTKYLLEYIVTPANEKEYAVSLNAHALVNNEDGTMVLTRMTNNKEPRNGSNSMILRYLPQAIGSYAHYRETAKEQRDLLADLVGSGCGPQMSYWMDKEGKQVCMQCLGGYLLGEVEKDYCMVLSFDAFLPNSRIMLPRQLWPAETLPYHEMITNVLENSALYERAFSPIPQENRIMITNEALKKEILDFVEPFGKLKSHYVSLEWRTLWTRMLTIPQVWKYVARPVAQAQTGYNRNSIAHIMAIMKEQKIILEDNNLKIACCQPLCNNNFRVNLGKVPDDLQLRELIRSFFDKEKKHTRLRN